LDKAYGVLDEATHTATFVAFDEQKPDQLAPLKVIIVLHHNFTIPVYTGYTEVGYFPPL